MNTKWHVRSNGLNFIIMDQHTKVVAECGDEAVARRIVRLHEADSAGRTGSLPQILSIDQVQLLLERGLDPVNAPVTLLQTFAAHRAIEARDQEWEHIKPGSSILISAHAAFWREVPFHEVLIPWLAPYFRLAPAGRLGRSIRLPSGRLAGAADDLGIRLSPGIWRHTYAAYRSAITRDDSLVAREMGIENSVIAERFLLPKVSAADAKMFFALTPSACRRGDWAEEVATAFAV